jgi:hypothetical protein
MSDIATLEIKADLEELQIVIATIDTQMFDIHVQGLYFFFESLFQSVFVQVPKLICFTCRIKHSFI